MRPPRLLWLMILMWLAIYAWSICVFFSTPPVGDGFTRGLNGLAGFMTWQATAGGIALAIWVAGRRLASGSLMRWISRGPALLALLLIVAIVLLIAYALIADRVVSPPSSSPASTPVTTPVN